MEGCCLSLEKALIVGLGNPGAAYRGTRHNIGFETIDELARIVGASWIHKREKCLIALAVIEDCKVVLVKPQTFMNLSGGAVAASARKYGIVPQNIIVIHDDMDLELGRVRVKLGGGDGGHKGVRSISQSLGSKVFARVRLGIGRPPSNKSAEEYVLERFDAFEKPAVAFLIENGVEAAKLLLKQDCEYVQNIVHGKKLTPNGAKGIKSGHFSLASNGIL